MFSRTKNYYWNFPHLRVPYVDYFNSFPITLSHLESDFVLPT